MRLFRNILKRLSKRKCDWDKCKKRAFWEVSFSKIIKNDSMDFLCGDEPDFQKLFCDVHLEDVGACGNSLFFRKIGDKKWIDIHEYDLILQKFVKGRKKHIKID